MSVPNHFPIVQQVYAAGHYDLTTKIGCGRCIEDVAFALNQADHRYGHLKKPNSLGGANKWNGHAVDNVCYLNTVAGRATAIDILRAGESTDAALVWNPDQENRYLASDWFAPTSGDAFQMVPHGTRLGCSLFPVMRAQYGDDPQLTADTETNARAIKERLEGDYIRWFVTTGGKDYSNAAGQRADPWQFAGSFRTWNNFKVILARAIDWTFDHGLLSAPTLVGEGAQFGSEQDLLDLCDLFADVVRDGRMHKIELVECWNEYELTGGNAGTIRRMASRLRSRLGSEFPIALDTPPSAMSAPVGEQEDKLPAEVSTFYGGSAANVITPQWDRTQPNPRDMGATARPLKKYSHEPRGVGSSVAEVTDWLPIAHDYIQCALLAYSGYTAHPGHAAIFEGKCHPYWPQHNQYRLIFDHPNMAAIADALKDVKHGRNPNPQTEEPPMPCIAPYDEDWINKTVIPEIVKKYEAHQVPVDPGMGAWVARAEYRTATGQTQTEALPVVLAELESALSGR